VPQAVPGASEVGCSCMRCASTTPVRRCVQMFFHVWEHNPNVVLGMWSEFIARQHTSGTPAPAHVISDMGLVLFDSPCLELPV